MSVMDDVGIMVEMRYEQLNMPQLVSKLLAECSAITDYRVLRDSLPRRLAHLLKCRAVLLYQKVEETLQFVAGVYDDKSGWSAALLSVVHINPVPLMSDVVEARAFTTRSPVCVPAKAPTLIAVPLIYRQRAIGVLVAIRSDDGTCGAVPYWKEHDVQVVEGMADIAALLLENTRLLERDKERIHELSLLNSVSSQLNQALYDAEHVHSIIVHCVRETTGVDLCDLLEQTPSIASSKIPPWISPALRNQLFTHFHQQSSSLPLLIDCSSTSEQLQDYVAHLPSDIKTFFAVPLLRPQQSKKQTVMRGVRSNKTAEQRVSGIVVGAYYKTSRLRREEIALLQVISSQAGAALENSRLIADVTEARNEARKLLRRVLADQRLKELVFESISSGLITIDMRGRITTFNHAASAILGYEAREVVGRSLYTLLTTSPGGTTIQEPEIHTFSSASSLRPMSLRTPLNTMQHGTLVTQNRKGHEVFLEVDVLPLCDERSNQVGAVVTCTDMTSMRRLEEEKRRLDRLASLGEMAANVAHEVRNPLASIKVSIQMLMDDLTEELSGQEEQKSREQCEGQGQQSEKHTWVQESTSVILKEVERLDVIVRDLLLFARPRQLHRTSCSLVALSDHVLHLLQPQCVDGQVTVCRNYHATSPVLVDAGQIEQVLFNLFTNALQAMPEGGILTISSHITETPLLHETQRIQAISDDSEVTQWLELRISDTGVGIAEEQLEHIFQPFFTTKAHGIGLGLSITRRLVEDHGGSLRAESRLGYGTTITLRLPIYQEQEEDDIVGSRFID
ncbi:MAG TPA: hypothetical protein DHW02_15570 [Ktedonobacter sp.]|nr:hypothetical protein [Ktedonobacter sp.]